MRSPIVHVPVPANYRPLRFGVTRALLREGADGVRYLRGEGELQSHAARMTDRLVDWAGTQPGRVFMARRRRNTAGYPSSTRHAIAAWNSESFAFRPRAVHCRASSRPKLRSRRSAAPSAASSVATIPPSPTANALVACIEKTSTHPACPKRRPSG